MKSIGHDFKASNVSKFQIVYYFLFTLLHRLIFFFDETISFFSIKCADMDENLHLGFYLKNLIHILDGRFSLKFEDITQSNGKYNLDIIKTVNMWKKRV